MRKTYRKTGFIAVPGKLVTGLPGQFWMPVTWESSDNFATCIADHRYLAGRLPFLPRPTGSWLVITRWKFRQPGAGAGETAHAPRI